MRRLSVALLALLVLFGALAPPASAYETAGDASMTFSLPAVSAVDGQLVAAGAPFKVRGVNYLGPTGAGDGCAELHFGADGNCPWDQQAIEADFKRLRGRGVNTVRIFLNYYVFGGAQAADPAYSLDMPLAHLDALLASASRHGIYLLPVLLAKYPQDAFTPEGYRQALELHVGPLVEHLAGRPGLLGWDLFNEPDIGSPVDERCWDWDNADFPLCAGLAAERIAFLGRLADDVRARDPGRPLTIGVAFAKSYFRPEGAPARLADMVDVFSFHYYDNDPVDSGRYAQHWYYGQGFPHDLRRAIDELHGLGLSKPVLVSEIGFPSGPGARRDGPALRRDLLAGVATVNAAGAAGSILWPFQPRPEQLVSELFVAP